MRSFVMIVYKDQRNAASFTRIDSDTGLIISDLIGRSFVVKYTYLFDFLDALSSPTFHRLCRR